MVKIKTKDYIKDIAFAILAGTFVVGGLGTQRQLYVFYFGLILPVLLLVINLIWKNKFKFPPYFFLYLIFLAVSAIGINWSMDRSMSYEVLILFLSAGAFWLFFYNTAGSGSGLISNTSEWFEKIVIYLGIVFPIFYLYAKFKNLLVSPFGLSLYLQEKANHNHIGDLQAIVLILVIHRLNRDKKNKLKWWILAGISLVFLVISESRSAYLSLIIGFLYLANSYGWIKEYKRIIQGLVIAALFLFLIVGSQKSILFSRDYYFQAASGIIDKPFGVGLGNFAKISIDPKYHVFGLSSYAKFVHNIILEIFVGIGVFGFIFLFWLIKVLYDFLNIKKSAVVYVAVFLALLTNFFFDYTYFTPTLLWLWFASLGLIQAGVKKS